MSKILYVASSMSHINNFHLPYIAKLKEEGNTVLVMAKGEGADFNVPFAKKILSLKNLFCRLRIRRILKRERFDSVVLNTTLAAFHVRRAMKRKDRPRVVNIVHGYLFSKDVSRLKRKLLIRCEKALAKKTDSIIAMNSSDYEAANEMRLCLGSVRLIKGMGAKIKEEEMSCDAVRRYTDSEGKFLLGFVGELSERKNQRFLICALPEIKMLVPKVELMLVGSGGTEKELRRIAQRLGIYSYIHFTGQRSNPCDFIRATDIYVSASEIEGMPFNIIEALGCGKTVLCSDVKGHVDLIENGRTGFLYKFGDVCDFVKKVKEIYDGTLSPDKDAIIKKYEEYSLEGVFAETYSQIKESII